MMDEPTCKYAKGCGLDPCPIMLDLTCPSYEESALFVPLNTPPYREFETGTKDTEFRPYGPRWNERTCRIGRPVILARGYSTPDRLRAVISEFSKITPEMASPAYHAIYGEKHAGQPVAAIRIKLVHEGGV